MIVKNLPQIGSPKLRLHAKSVSRKEIGESKTRRLIRNLADTMRANDLIGMALPQVGVSKRIIAIEVRETKVRKLGNIPLQILINPRIVERSESTKVDYEGCGSVVFGDLFGPVRRHKSVVVEYLDQDGKHEKKKFSGISSVVIQHECDHLDGVLFTDRVYDNKRFINRDAYIEMRKKSNKKKYSQK